MNPVIVIPTFVSARRRKEGGSVLTTYDHATPISQPGELPRLLASLQKVRGAGQIIVLVVSEPSIENQAAEKGRSQQPAGCGQPPARSPEPQDRR